RGGRRACPSARGCSCSSQQIPAANGRSRTPSRSGSDRRARPGSRSAYERVSTRASHAPPRGPEQRRRPRFVLCRGDPFRCSPSPRMPRRQDLKSILILGSGPIVIGQACEFDYSGVQACKALRADGYKIILINSNPATIMTDPEMADRTYIEPINPETVAKIIEQERPDAVLPTLGGQTALNCAMQLHDMGVLQKFGVEMIGAKPHAIERAEGRQEFRAGMEKIGLVCARSRLAYDMHEARKALDEIGLPCVIRPGFTLGGTGGGIAYNLQEFEEIAARGLELSLNSEILVEE